MTDLSERYRKTKRDLVTDTTQCAYLYRYPLLKGSTIRDVYDKLDTPVPLIVTEDEKNNLEYLILTLRGLREIIMSMKQDYYDPVSEYLKSQGVLFAHNISICRTNIEYLGYSFTKKKNMCWAFSMFSITKQTDARKHYLIKQVGLSNMYLGCTEKKLKQFLFNLKYDIYQEDVYHIDATLGIEYLKDIWKEYQKKHIFCLKTDRVIPEYEIKEAVIREPAAYAVLSREEAERLEKLIS